MFNGYGPIGRLRIVLTLFLGRTEVITGASQAKKCEEFQFYVRKVLATPKLDESKRKRDSRNKQLDVFFFFGVGQ